MKLITIFAVSTTLLSSAFGDLAPLIKGKGKVIKGSYLITLKGNTRTTLDAHIKSVKELFTDRRINKIESIFNHIGNTYHATLSKSTVEKIRNLPEVDFIEQDIEIKPQSVQNGAEWGLARISQRNFTNKSTYTYNGDGSGVTVYVVDSGILITHPEFEGRAHFGKRFMGDSDLDDYGHGTHCAGTIGSKTYGVAKKVDLVAVKVFDSQSSTVSSILVGAINWIIADKRGVKGNVINISLAGGKTKTLNNAIEVAYQNGFVVVVAAGNKYQDACDFSPASAPNAITVAASDNIDRFASFSNYGECIDIIAPGVSITSTWHNGGNNNISGTSFSSPHVAGLAAYYLSKETLTNSQLREKIVNTATKNVFNNLKAGTPNLLAYNSIV